MEFVHITTKPESADSSEASMLAQISRGKRNVQKDMKNMSEKKKV